MKKINDIIYWFITSGTATATLAFAWLYLKPLLEAKKQHAKTEQAKLAWSHLEQVADTAVSSLVSADLTGEAKFTQATAIVQSVLNKQGFTNVDVKAIESAVQAAYEKSPSDSFGQKVSDPVPGTVEAIDPMKGEN